MQTGKLTIILSGCILASLLLGSASAADCVSAYDSSENYFPFAYTNDSDPFALPLDVATVNTAFDFTVQYSSSYKIVKNRNSNYTYILYQCGSPAPKGLGNNTRLFEIPIKYIGITGGFPVAYLELLGLISRVKQGDKYMALPYVTSACMQKIVAEDKVQPLNTSTNVFIIEDMFSLTGSKNAVSFDSTSDPGALKRAEWIKYLAMFLNLEAEATNIYETIRKNYECLNGSSTLTVKPVVAWLSYYDLAWTVSSAEYKKNFVRDAGGLSLDDKYFGMYNVTNSTQLKSFKQLLKTVNVVIDESYAMDPTSYGLSNFTTNAQISPSDSSFPFIAEKRLWREDRRITSSSALDWLETAPAQPQIVIQELISIFDPSRTSEPYFFRNIAKGEGVVMVTEKQCTRDYNKPLAPMVFTCPLVSPSASVSSASLSSLLHPLLLLSLLAFVSKFLW